jgi:hypothetical protein
VVINDHTLSRREGGLIKMATKKKAKKAAKKKK